MNNTDIVIAYPEDYDQIMEVWKSSVKATHDFLKQEDFEFYQNAIPNNYLPNLDVYLLRLSKKNSRIHECLGRQSRNVIHCWRFTR